MEVRPEPRLGWNAFVRSCLTAAMRIWVEFLRLRSHRNVNKNVICLGSVWLTTMF
ncbi:hypothetical protein BJY04DRAFT_175383 [Aspergillus karnatakaensis]|uniref:uncharacterized protein n=1 Tax=Aspergillus karnatakaensis TaxID=1810916 RepID=UPI003CCDCDB4